MKNEAATRKEERNTLQLIQSSAESLNTLIENNIVGIGPINFIDREPIGLESITDKSKKYISDYKSLSRIINDTPHIIFPTKLIENVLYDFILLPENNDVKGYKAKTRHLENKYFKKYNGIGALENMRKTLLVCLCVSFVPTTYYCYSINIFSEAVNLFQYVCKLIVTATIILGVAAWLKRWVSLNLEYGLDSMRLHQMLPLDETRTIQEITNKSQIYIKPTIRNEYNLIREMAKRQKKVEEEQMYQIKPLILINNKLDWAAINYKNKAYKVRGDLMSSGQIGYLSLIYGSQIGIIGDRYEHGLLSTLRKRLSQLNKRKDFTKFFTNN